MMTASSGSIGACARKGNSNSASNAATPSTGKDLRARPALRLCEVPFHFERITTLEGCESVLAEHCHALRDFLDIDHAGYLACRGVVEEFHLGPEMIGMRDQRHQHVGCLDID